MLLNCLFLAISSSIDSLGIGITYGIKNTKITLFAKFILFLVAFTISTISIYFGNILKYFLPDFIIDYLGSFILIFMGFFMCFQALRNNKKDCKISSDTNLNDTEKIYSFYTIINYFSSLYFILFSSNSLKLQAIVLRKFFLCFVTAIYIFLALLYISSLLEFIYLYSADIKSLYFLSCLLYSNSDTTFILLGTGIIAENLIIANGLFFLSYTKKKLGLFLYFL